MWHSKEIIRTALQTFQELQQAKAELEQLRELAAEHGPLVEELAATRAQVRELEKQRSQYDSMASRAAAAIESRLSSTAQERDKLLEQASTLWHGAGQLL